MLRRLKSVEGTGLHIQHKAQESYCEYFFLFPAFHMVFQTGDVYGCFIPRKGEESLKRALTPYLRVIYIQTAEPVEWYF